LTVRAVKVEKQVIWDRTWRHSCMFDDLSVSSTGLANYN